MGEKIVWKKSYFSKRIFERSCNLPSKIVHPLPPSETTDRSILLATHLRNEGYFCFVSRLRSTRRGSKCFKGSTLILFQLQKSASESKKVCSRTNRRAWIFAPFEVRYIVLWSHLLLHFFLSFFFLLLLLYRVLRSSIRSIRWNGNEEESVGGNIWSFIFTRR